ncbi:FAD binding domain-containing protein [Microdochium trichocladiopsis]|uniref:FAD binding domain-containing protein n=1 Tax=Microdochium trichocladiopsis TaxID=1682393 RepID=A0A9P8Y5B1_9PEZI|nr:FAD binding domain-containing protein [Microdochium trichocladiopsis]KAH7030611.1 FAD binding domain-containing protein [Microdochium trichocladiopsis]
MHPIPEQIDVLVCGAGPAGLLTALGLEQQGINTLVIDKRARDEQEATGRATTLFPRSLELLDQLGLTDDITQECFIARSDATFNNGVRSTERGWHEVFASMRGTYHDYCVNIRQRYSEEIFGAKYATLSSTPILYGWGLVGFELEKLEGDDDNITAILANSSSGQEARVRCKYLVGADGGNSTVRRLAGITMEGDETTMKWIRLDGKFETDLPDANLGFAAIETKTHGNVLWVRLDKDAHRVGISLPAKLQEKYRAGITQEQAVAEAVQAMQPFKLDVQRVDWWTLYSIKQKVAVTLQQNDFILLVGDAAHTHSSGFAQGMNTAIHDATNLIWKLSGTLKGWYSPSTVLPSYATERHAAARKLISIDVAASAAISGAIPDGYGPADSDPDDVLARVVADNTNFTLGAGVQYGPSCINRLANTTSVSLGNRAPDALVRRPGIRLPRRLQEIALVNGPGKWFVLVFGGWHLATRDRVNALREEINTGGLGKTPREMLNMATLFVGVAANAWDALGGPAIGRLYFDHDGDAHSKYCISLDDGAIVVIRPDGVFGFAARLHELAKVKDYFEGFCL